MLLENHNAISEVGGNYQIANSLRFQSESSQYLSKVAPSVSTNTLWTYSAWIKRGSLGTTQALLSGGSSTTFYDELYFSPANELVLYQLNGGSVGVQLTTTQVFRDPSAWYHLILVWDTAQTTASNRIKMYVNGVQITSFGTATYPPLNNTSYIFLNSATLGNTIGKWVGASTEYFDGYISELNFVTGQALTPSSFGETDTTTGQWVAKKYTGTYGTNGFYLPFSNGTSTTTLGADSSGNSNNWTLNNFTRSAGVSDCWMYDVPSGNGGASGTQPSSNYCVLNPLASGSSPTRANLEWNPVAKGTRGSIAFPSSGLFYTELTLASTASNVSAIGYGLVTSTVATNSTLYAVSNAWGIYGVNATYLTRNGSVSAGLGYTMTSGDVYQLAVDLANGRAWLGKNNAWYDGTTGTTGNPAAGTNPTFTSLPSELFLALYGDSGQVFNINFGQRSFQYTPPSGFKALCTANLPAATIKKGNAVFNAVTWTGNNSTSGRSITGVGFSPDIIWAKNRTTVVSNVIYDSIRGAGNNKELVTDSTLAEGVNNNDTYDYLSSIDSDGFSSTWSGSNTTPYFNLLNNAFVAWCWDAGSSTVTNTNGSISSQVRANPTAGVSVVTYTGTGANATVGHGLGVAPKMIIVKNRQTIANWPVWHTALSGTEYLFLNTTAAKVSNATYWNSTIPTSTVFSLGAQGQTNNPSDSNVAYCFAAIQGFSAMGSYTGNGSTDGPFIYTNLTPRFILIKRTDTAADWFIYDTSRNPYNASKLVLFPNLSSAEATSTISDLDIVSNGFKIRGTSTDINASGGTYIYMAFAECPFSSSNSR